MRIVTSLSEATMLQQTYLALMAADDINHDRKVEEYLKVLCEAMGVKFKK